MMEPTDGGRTNSSAQLGRPASASLRWRQSRDGRIFFSLREIEEGNSCSHPLLGYDLSWPESVSIYLVD